jgi:NADPH:quinone reductase
MRSGGGVPPECSGSQSGATEPKSYRQFGTTEFTVVPLDQVARLPPGASIEQGACLGIPGITTHRAVPVAGVVRGQTVLIQRAAGAVGLCSVQLARRA